MGDRPQESEHRSLTLPQFLVLKKYNKEDLLGSLRGSSYLINKILPLKIKIYYLFNKNYNVTTVIKMKQDQYYDYQLSKAQRKFGDKVLAIKLWCCHGKLSLFPVVTISTAVHHLLCFVSFAANDIKGQQVATGNGACCP